MAGGHTWAKEAINGLYIITTNFQEKSGFAVGSTLSSGVELLRYRQPKEGMKLSL